ncbi:MAG: hypothetical protein Alpg2KO_01290 [Alphaproteobacteria bacterium]
MAVTCPVFGGVQRTGGRAMDSQFKRPALSDMRKRGKAGVTPPHRSQAVQPGG